MKNISSNVRSNDTNFMYAPTKAEGIAVCSVFIVADVFMVSGNLLTLVLFALGKKLRKRSLFLVINMAFSDLLLGILTLPVYIVITGSSYRLWNFEISRNLEISFYFVDTALSQASLNFCSLYLLGEILCYLLASQAPNSVHSSISCWYFCCMGILYFCLHDLQLVTMVKDSKGVFILLDTLCGNYVAAPVQLQHWYLEEIAKQSYCFAKKHNKFATTDKNVVASISARFNLLASLGSHELFILWS